MIFFVNYQQFKHTDRSDNPPLRTWKIETSDAESAFVIAQERAVQLTLSGRKVGGVRRVMRHADTDDLVTANGNLTESYLKSVVRW
jgi:hypothetical protein